ncbi:MAG: cytochrome b [Methylovirgula sp.]
MKLSLAPSRYDSTTLWLHWLTALLVIEQWIGAHTIDDFAKGWPRTAARSVHITLGVTLAVILILRIFWRMTRGQILPPPGPGLMNIIASAVHYALYALLVVTVGAGVCFAFLRGDSWFGLFHLPMIAAGNKVLRHYVAETHVWSANLILGFAGLHALAALFHQYVLKDGLLRRMMPSR